MEPDECPTNEAPVPDALTCLGRSVERLGKVVSSLEGRLYPDGRPSLTPPIGPKNPVDPNRISQIVQNIKTRTQEINDACMLLESQNALLQDLG
jgi:hypothetical protein